MHLVIDLLPKLIYTSINSLPNMIQQQLFPWFIQHPRLHSPQMRGREERGEGEGEGDILTQKALVSELFPKQS